MKTLCSILLLAILPLSSIAQCTDPPGQPGPITGLDPACPGGTAVYSISPVPDATSYIWTIPGGWSGASTTTSITVNVGTSPGAISVAAVNNCGTSNAQVYTATIFTATITPQGALNVCSDNLPLVLNANTGVGFFYQWFNGSSQIAGATGASYNVTASGTYSVQVASNSCMQHSAPVTVSITQMPDITASSNGPGCAGMQLNFSGTSSASGVTYDWTGPNNFPGVQNPSIASASLSDAGTYTLTVTNGPCHASTTVPVVIYQGVPATPSPIDGPSELCAYESGVAYQVTNDPNAAQYNWTVPNSWSGSSLINNIHIGAGQAGNYTVSVTAQNGCGISAPVTKNVTVHPLPQPVIIQSGNTLTVTQTFASYQWYSGITTLIPGATGQSFTPTQPGDYSVVVTTDENCAGQSILASFTTGVAAVNYGKAMNLYPSPNTGSFTIEGAFASGDGKANVVITDISGRVVHCQQVSVHNGQLSESIDMNSTVAQGVYTIRVSSDAATAVVPFAKN